MFVFLLFVSIGLIFPASCREKAGKINPKKQLKTKAFKEQFNLNSIAYCGLEVKTKRGG